MPRVHTFRKFRLYVAIAINDYGEVTASRLGLTEDHAINRLTRSI